MHITDSTFNTVTRRPVFRTQRGLSLTELLITVAIAAVIMAGLAGVVNQTLNTEDVVRERNDLTQQARFAMQRMVAAVKGTRHLLIPLGENPATGYSESIRSVLAVTLDPTIDRDRDGWADANNDKDFLDLNNNSVRDSGEPERVDEDIGKDNTNDEMPGIIGIDDNGDGNIDDSSAAAPSSDNDEDDVEVEDKLDGIDNDNDGSIDEDITKDMNDDGLPGVAGIDDDYDGLVDENAGSKKNDDDEDGLLDEDWFDAVVYYLNANQLIERLPSLIDTNGDSVVTGADFSESVIAENVTQFRIERIPQGSGRAVLLDITLVLTAASGKTVTLNTRLRPGGGS